MNAPAQQRSRLAGGGVIDRTSMLRFRFDGRDYTGCAGDTLASALLANGVHLVGRSFKYHRPRGIFSAGSEEPNAVVRLGEGTRAEPNAVATRVELHEGLIATPQNGWPSLRMDFGAITNLLSRFLPAGFYYKTFMWPASPAAWLRYEHVIRRAAGAADVARGTDPDCYEHRFAHCDVLVVGAGPTGLAAARAAAQGGARVILCDEDFRLGGRLVGEAEAIDGQPSARWLREVEAELAALPDVTLLPGTTAFGHYDGNLVALVEQLRGASRAPAGNAPRLRLWKVRARAVVFATGALERPIAYANNDLPGTLLAGAVQTYVNRYGVRPGSRAVVFTNNDSAYAAALALHRAGVEVAAIVDPRAAAAICGTLPEQARAAGLPILEDSVLTGARGRMHVVGVDVASANPGSGAGKDRRIDCDLVCVSGGWNPVVHLFSQAGGRLHYDDVRAAFVPESTLETISVAGAAAGTTGLREALENGHAAGIRALGTAGFRPHAQFVAASAPAQQYGALRALWAVPARPHGAKRLVDLHSDVTADDIALAHREGYRSVEHLKRYTTLGMGSDQGKTSNVVGLALMAQHRGEPIGQVGTTTFRPPYTPVTMGALAGPAQGAHVEPTRLSSVHDWHAEHGARFVNAGLWRRPHSYPQTGETVEEAANREARNVRTAVGVVDVSTLGKIELQGRDVAEFLGRVYVNRWDSLALGRCRYGLMLREDGIVLDDGTTSRLGETHYLMTTTTANAAKVLQHLEYLLQVSWPELDVYVTAVTEQWTAAALSGPQARSVLQRVVDIDVSNPAFPFLAVGACHVLGADDPIPARLLRMSYSGELAYEIHVPADRGRAMWEAIMAAGADFGIMPYGTEAMSTLRIEKGHIVVGPEADGRTTADDLGLGAMVTSKKWCIGKPLLGRSALRDPQRWQLVGLTAVGANAARGIPRGGKIVADPAHPAPNPMLGHVSSWCWSPNLQASIGLALVENGRARHGETLWAVSPLADAQVQVRVGPPCFIDPQGERLRA